MKMNIPNKKCCTIVLNTALATCAMLIASDNEVNAVKVSDCFLAGLIASVLPYFTGDWINKRKRCKYGYEEKAVYEASDEAAVTAIGSFAGVSIGGLLTKNPGSFAAGSALGGYAGTVMAQGMSRKITIPSGSRPNYSGGVYSYDAYQNPRGSSDLPLWMLKSLSSADDPMLKLTG